MPAKLVQTLESSNKHRATNTTTATAMATNCITMELLEHKWDNAPS
jgi:hypothetical protein